MLGFSLLVLIVIWIASAMVASNVAEAKGLDGSSWALVAFFFGPIGLIGVAGMPDRRLRSYMRAVAIKLEAIKEQEVASIESLQQLPVAALHSEESDPKFFYVDSMLNSDDQRLAAVLSQLPEHDRQNISIKRSTINIGRMSFLYAKDERIFARLKYVDLKDGKHVFQKM